MSLNWNLTAVPEDVRLTAALVDEPMYGVKAGDKIMNPITHALIWSTMAVGIGELTEETEREFFERLELLRKLGLYGDITLWKGDVETGGWETRGITFEEVQAHRGLSTNVFPLETRASFVKRWITKTDTRSSGGVFTADEPKRKR